MAPIHHHFEKKGWAESTIVIRFWIIAIILALIGLATLKLRQSMLKIAKLKELSFLVYGLGSSGQSVIKFFKKKKIKKFKVWDDKKKNIYKKFRPKKLNETLKQVDYIVLTPGISLIKNKNLNKFKKKIITDIDLFQLNNNKSKSIVVTGTNGKSTTCKLLAHLFQRNKFKFSLGGNIGTPILNIKNSKNSYVIIELSLIHI